MLRWEKVSSPRSSVPDGSDDRGPPPGAPADGRSGPVGHVSPGGRRPGQVGEAGGARTVGQLVLVGSDHLGAEGPGGVDCAEGDEVALRAAVGSGGRSGRGRGRRGRGLGKGLGAAADAAATLQQEVSGGVKVAQGLVLQSAVVAHGCCCRCCCC